MVGRMDAHDRDGLSSRTGNEGVDWDVEELRATGRKRRLVAADVPASACLMVRAKNRDGEQTASAAQTRRREC